jgi:molybdate transport system ATP-binding protein
MLELEIRMRLGAFTLDAALAVPAGVVMAVVGESGAGKTTLLRLVAGLADPDEGRIAIHGRVLFDGASGTSRPPFERPIGYVAQDYALFPHLSVRDNVAFGLRALGRPAAEVRERVDRALEGVGLAALASRRPRRISGGEQQRVALARALILDPEVLLLDEPLAALDPATRREIRGELRRALKERSCPTLLVTHDPADALSFGDRIAVIERGRITQQGSRDEFLRDPRSRYAAEFLGVNVLEGEIVSRQGGIAELSVDGMRIAVVDSGADSRARVILHPREIVISIAAPAGSARNVLRGPVTELLAEGAGGEQVRVRLGTRPALTAEITRRSAEALGLSPGLEVYASFKASAMSVLPG